MFGIGSTELLVILVVALIVLGPKSIPGLAKTLGKVMGEFRRVSTDFQRTMNAEMAQDEHEKRKKEAEEELFGSKVKPEATSQTQSAPQTAQAAAPTTSQPAAPHPADDDTPPASPASTATIDAASASSSFVTAASASSASETPAHASAVPTDSGMDVAPDSPLAQAVARAEAEARGEVYSPTAAASASTAAPVQTSPQAPTAIGGEKA